MQNGLVILVVVTALILFVFIKRKWESASPAGQAAAELKRLTEAYAGQTDSPEDLASWEKVMSVMEQHPNEYNKLNEDIRFVRAFAGYLEKHHPEDARLESLRQYANYRKDSIWGIPIKKE